MTPLMMNSNWNVPTPVTVEPQLLGLFPDNPVFAEILYRRGIRTLAQAQAFLYPRCFPQSDPFNFPHMQDAVQMVMVAIQQGIKIGICGDFDTDGLCATAILYEGLLELTPDVEYQVPARSRESHGISEDTVRFLYNKGVRLLITCDTGISEYAGIQCARDLGMQVIVTDHHSPPETPANASVIIIPEYLPEQHPMRSLSGSGVAYKFIQALFQFSSCEISMARFTDLAAIGIVGDMVPLIGEARFLTQSGISILQNPDRQGLREIYNCSNVSLTQVNEKIITHVIGPRLNSLSRSMDGNAAVELLTTRDIARAQLLAKSAEEANTKRKQMTDTLLMAAQNSIEQDRSLLDKPILFLENDGWHYSVLGLVASTLADRYSRPVVLISSFDENTSRGSARSVAGIDITAVIAENAGMLDQFGGHAMAAGFSIKKEKLVDFRRALMSAVSQIAVPEPQLTIDALLPLWGTSKPGFGETCQLFRPFGPFNPGIHFMTEDLRFLDSVYFGKNMQHCRLNVATRKLTKHSVVWWNGAGKTLPPEQFDLVYQIAGQKTNSQTEIQIILEAFRPHEKAAALLYSRTPGMEVIDWRKKSITDPDLIQMARQEDTFIFSEGLLKSDGGLPIHTRQEISPCRILILLTSPARYDILLNLLHQASPEKVYVVALSAELDQKTAFMQAVTQFILDAIRTSQGSIHVPDLAAKTGQTEGSIRLAVEWLVSKTTLQYKLNNGKEIILDRSGSPEGDELIVLEELEKSLEETAAFKRFFQTTELNTLFSDLETENL